MFNLNTDPIVHMTGANMLLCGLLASMMLDLGTHLIENRFYGPFTILTLIMATANTIYQVQVQQMPSFHSPLVGPLLFATLTLLACSVCKLFHDRQLRRQYQAAHWALDEDEAYTDDFVPEFEPTYNYHDFSEFATELPPLEQELA